MNESEVHVVYQTEQVYPAYIVTFQQKSAEAADALAAALAAEVLSKGGGAASGGNPGSTRGRRSGNRVAKAPPRLPLPFAKPAGGSGGGAGGGGGFNFGGGAGAGSSLLQDKVLAEFSKSADESGMDIKDVIKAMESQGVNGAQVREAVEYLAGEGHLYSTIDEEHFKSTAC